MKPASRLRDVLRILLSHYVTNGITAGLGLFCISLLVDHWLGAYAASVATVGVIAATPSDVVGPRRGKLRSLLPAFLFGIPVFYAVQMLNGHPLELGIFLTVLAFLAFLAMAWGKRGVQVAMGLMLTAIFSMATHGEPGLSPSLRATTYFATGAGLYVLWATLANLALNARYRALMVAETLASLASLIRTEARQFQHRRTEDRQADDALLGELLRAQAALAEQMQAARDVVLESPRTPYRQRLAGMLVIVFDIRDNLLASELDLETLRTHPRHRHALAQMRRILDELADEVTAIADALVLGYRPRPAIDRRNRIATIRSISDAEAGGMVLGPTPAMLVRGIAHRIGHINDEILRLSGTARGEQTPNLAVVRAKWQMFVSPTAWSWGPILSVWSWKTPQLRHAIRAALAIAVGYAISVNLPWGGSHPYWILLTVAQVLRGSLSQTLERRNQRVAGTLFGCALAMGLMALHPSLIVYVVVMMLSQSIAHSFAQRRYLITSVAGTVLGLIQAHLVGYGEYTAAFTLFERLADTIIGAAVAWAFCYILPSWERGQIPAVVRRTLDAQLRHARLALDPAQLGSVESTPELEWRLARREAFDSLSALVQATQRSLSEPRAVRPPVEALQHMQVHCYQLLAQLSAVKSLLVLRRDRLNIPEASEALAFAVDRIERKLAGVPLANVIGDATPAGSLGERAILPDPFETQINPWLMRRLDASTGIAIQIRSDAARVLMLMEDALESAEASGPQRQRA
ncbi:MAG: FUSC family membrane protein [Lautropia sp.]|nr:FUSC family membrane protein [Lautropia sp.]